MKNRKPETLWLPLSIAAAPYTWADTPQRLGTASDDIVVTATRTEISPKNARSSANTQNTSETDSSGQTIPQDFTDLERFETNGEMGEGSGVKAGTTYRLDDGSLIFVPEQ